MLGFFIDKKYISGILLYRNGEVVYLKEVILMKQKIIEAARNLFTKYGFKKVSMDEIAVNAGTTKKTVYSYFKTKGDLFEYFINEELTNMKNITLDIEKKNVPLIDKFHEMVYELIKYKKKSSFINIVTHEVKELKTEDIKNLDDKITNSIKDFIEEKLTIAIKNKEIKDINVKFATFLIYTVYVTVVFAYPSEDLNEEEVSNALTIILKDGLLLKGDK